MTKLEKTNFELNAVKAYYDAGGIEEQKELFLENLRKGFPKSTVEKVSEFHKLFQPKHTSDVIKGDLEIERRQLRVKLIFEELKELSESLGIERTFYDLCQEVENVDTVNDTFNFINLTETIDALSDLQYVLDGTYDELGLGKIKDESFDIVHRSNMSKACSNVTEATETVAYYQDKDIEASCDTHGIVRRKDGKILKSLYYRTATEELNNLILNTIENEEMERSSRNRIEKDLFSDIEE